MPECTHGNACIMEGRIAKLEEWKKGSEKFHDSSKEFQDSAMEKIIRMEGSIGSIDTSVKQLVTWQSDQQQKPGKLVDKLTENILWLIIAAAVGYFLGQIGLV